MSLEEVLREHVGEGKAPGLVALVARGDEVEFAAVGSVDVEGSAPMRRDTLFRVASLTKPITAAAVMLLVDDGVVALGDPVAKWLPELADPVVVRTPRSQVDDVVPVARPITVADILESRAGWGFPEDFTFPAVGALFQDAYQGPPQPQKAPQLDEWLAALAGVPMLFQPGEAWLYNTCSDVQGVLVARASGQPLPEFFAERFFAPLGMRDTAFAARDLARFTSYYRPLEDGGLELVDAPDGQWSTPPAFPSGAGGLVSTADDLLAFSRMLLSGGGGILAPESVRLMTTDHTTAAQRAASTLFLEGQGWGYGGSVDIEAIEPWNVPGRYGWVGGSGTASYLTPSTGTATILLSQLELAGPTPPAPMRALWRYAA